jgi:spore maturation protein CgeB
MKILYISSKNNYGDPQREFFYQVLRNMDNNKHQVVYFDFDELMNKWGRNRMNEILIETVDKEKPNLCFFFIRRDEIKKETIKEISGRKETTTLNWFADDHWRFDNFSKYWAPCFNWIATTDSQAREKYRKIGYNKAISSQWGFNHFFYKFLDLPKIYDVSFIGQPHGNRKKIIAKLKKAGIEVNCWGKGWPNGWVSNEEMMRIFSQTKINLSFTKSSNYNIVKSIGGIFLKKLRRGKRNPIVPENPCYWWDNVKSLYNRKRKQIRTRDFDILGCKSFVLSEAADNIEDYYQNNKEIVIFYTIEELILKIKYYLVHPEEREKIAQAGYGRTLKDHTYEKRFQQIFKTIGLYNSADL